MPDLESVVLKNRISTFWSNKITVFGHKRSEETSFHSSGVKKSEILDPAGSILKESLKDSDVSKTSSSFEVLSQHCGLSE